MVTVWWHQDKREQCAVIRKKVVKRIRGTKEEKSKREIQRVAR
jgi:hypothetical protein